MGFQSWFACFLLAINYGGFVESNFQKLRQAQLKRIMEPWETRPALGIIWTQFKL